MAAFPVIKLGFLALNQISKPLAKFAKAKAKQSPFFRNYICMPPAQFYHWAEVKMKMLSLNLGKPVQIPKLNEAAAIELGAELLGEGILFVIAGGILTYEYIRSSKKEDRKEKERLAELLRIQNDLRNLYMASAKKESELEELVRMLNMRMPEVTFTPPKEINQSLIPVHHKDSHKHEMDKSYYSYFKGLIWEGIELIFEPDDDE